MRLISIGNKRCRNNGISITVNQLREADEELQNKFTIAKKYISTMQALRYLLHKHLHNRKAIIYQLNEFVDARETVFTHIS